MHPMFRTTNRILLGMLGIALFVVTVNGQAPARQQPSPGVPPSEQNHFIETPKGWVHPMTPWGELDLEGTWPIPGGINLVRGANSCPANPGRGRGAAPAPGTPPPPPCDPTSPWLSDAEWKVVTERYEQLQKVGDASTQALARGDFGAALQGGVTDPTTPYRQRSTIMDPPDGRLPELTEEGRRRSALMRSSWTVGGGEVLIWDHWEDFDSWDRCITRGMPTSMMAYRYNNGIKIFQAPGMVVLSLEMIHEDRIIYTDGRAPLQAVHKHYMGEPRGRWEGTTLVVETTNYKPGPSGTNLGVYGTPPGIPGGNRWPVSEQMKTTERFTRLNDDFMLYEMTVEDPIVMTRPYTVRFPIKQDPTYEWWEYACHEGNRTIRDYINASRAERAAAAAGEGQQPAAPAPGAGRATGAGRGN
jgi:hypothetical protein